MAGLRTTAPPTLAPERPGRGRAGRPVRPVRLADRAAGRGLERARRVRGRGGRRRRRVRGEPRGPDRPARPIRADALPGPLARRDRQAARRRPAGPDRPRPARPHRLRARRLAQGARDPARRGPAVRLDRRRDRPPEGGPGGRHGARPQPRAADRAVPPGRPDGRHDRPVLARRAGQQADDPGRRGPRPRRARGAGASRRSAHRLRHDQDRLPADLPARAPGARPAPARVPLAGEAAAARLPACKVCRPASAAAAA